MPTGSYFIIGGDAVDRGFIELFAYDLHGQGHAIVVEPGWYGPVSYTHLTLPTICSV